MKSKFIEPESMHVSSLIAGLGDSIELILHDGSKEIVKILPTDVMIISRVDITVFRQAEPNPDLVNYDLFNISYGEDSIRQSNDEEIIYKAINFNDYPV